MNKKSSYISHKERPGRSKVTDNEIQASGYSPLNRNEIYKNIHQALELSDFKSAKTWVEVTITIKVEEVGS